jgi:signal transduction histidine kinase
LLHDFISQNRLEIIARCRTKVATRMDTLPAGVEHDHGVPVFLDQLRDALRFGETTSPEIGKSAIKHGYDLLQQGFTVSQVVHDYGDVCQAVTELAVELNAPISTDDFRTLNRCLDDAIAGAVTEYGRRRTQSGIDGESARASERLGFLSHELRNLLNTAMMAFAVLKTGDVGVGGSTGTVLHRSLMAAGALISRSLAEVRLTQGLQHHEPFATTGFIAEVALAAMLEANARGVTLTVAPGDGDLAIDADRQILAAVIGNLLQNAFKFTRRGTTVALRVLGSGDRVRIEVEDECGGLPDGSADDLFAPFQQYGTDRSGVGLGLAFSKWGAEANNGEIHVRSLPGKGCVFTVDMPRVAVPVVPAIEPRGPVATP